jgi:RNA ligase (TIGR02306 family)
MRQLASIKKIKEIKPALNSDNLNLAYVDGWQVVVRKDENYQPGDLCVYIEIDSMLPDIPAFKFLTDKGIKRLRTIKLRQNLSQGLIMPLSILPDGDYNEEDDITDIMGITKYEPPIRLTAGQSKGSFPTDIVSITDETRIQSALEVIEELKGKPYYITVKCDGTSFTCLHMDEEFEVCSRTERKKEGNDSVYWGIANKYDFRDKLAAHQNLVIQGECCGPKIQSNRLELENHDLFVFNIYDTEKRQYLNYDEFLITAQMLELKTVPVLEEGDNFNYTFDELLAMADGKYEGTQNFREGIVVRAKEPIWSETLRGRLSFKVISNAYLLGQNNDDE